MDVDDTFEQEGLEKERAAKEHEQRKAAFQAKLKAEKERLAKLAAKEKTRLAKLAEEEERKWKRSKPRWRKSV